MKILAWICLGCLIFVLLAFVYYFFVGRILFKYVFSRRSLTSKSVAKDIQHKLEKYKVDLCWFDKHKMEKVQVTSFDGLKLTGYFLPANSNKSVIIVHGFGCNYKYMQQYCNLFYQKNFNILAVDCRAHGESEGKCVTFGWLDRLDVAKWVDFLNEKNPENKIVLFGVSMGGATVCSASAEKLKNVVAVISDCAFDNADREITYILSKKHIPFKKILKKHLYSYTKRLYNFDCLQADVIKQVKKTNVPILFIHGLEDDYVPVENLNNLYNATPTNMREKLTIEGAGHALAYPVGGVLYEKKISDFLNLKTPLDKY